MATSAMPLPNANAPLATAIAPGSFFGSISSRRIDSASGKIAVAAPWSTRPTISQSSECVTAASSVPAMRTRSRATRVGFLPRWSPNRPSSGVKTAADSRVAVVTQLAPAVVVCRLVWIRPRIGTTSVCIIDTTIAARLSARTVAVRLWPGPAGAVAELLMEGSPSGHGYLRWSSS